MSRRLPIIHRITEHDAGPYRLERLDLEFANGERRHYERLHGRGHGAVVVVPMLDADTVLLVREYAAGVHRYELGLVKGRIDAGETPEQAADRELKEEAGYGARELDRAARADAGAHLHEPPGAPGAGARPVSRTVARRRARGAGSGAVEAGSRCTN